jgi:hypothetical protein
MMARKLIVNGFLSSGLVLLAAGAYDFFSTQDQNAGLEVENPVSDFPSFPASQTSDVGFRLHNSSRHAVQVLGLAEC